MIKAETLKTSIVGTYQTLQAASKQVDLLLLGHKEVRVNNEPSEKGDPAHTVHAQRKTAFSRKRL